ncbi:MAG TPA: DUF1217 domain-containing protein [Roseiarcus sp.]
MSTTTSTYLSISQNLARYQQATADQPAVKTASQYYAANIGSVTSISQFVGNYRLLSYALDAYGLGDQVNNTALVTQVLQGGVSSSKSLANTLSNPNWAKFAAAFNFTGEGASSISTPTAVQTTTTNYVEEQLETQEGQQDPGVQLALYFQRVAPTISNPLSILGDTNLTDVVQTIFNLPPDTAATNVNAEASEINQLMPMSELQNPKELTQLTERFTAMYDLDYGAGGADASSPLIVNSDGKSSTTANAASTILSGVISGNSSATSSSTASLFNNVLLASMQSLTLGG